MQHQIDDQLRIVAKALVLRQRGGLSHRLRPRNSEGGVRAFEEQCIAPHHPDRQQLHQGVVVAPVKRVVPDAVARIGGPAADIDQRAVQIILDRAIGDAERADDRDDRVARIVGHGGDSLAEALDPHRLGVAVEPHRRAPGGVRRQRPRRQLPGRLTFVEISRAPLRDLVDHEGRARGLTVARRQAVENFGDSRNHRFWPLRHWLSRRRLAQRGGIARRRRMTGRRGDRRLQIAILDPSRRQRFAIEIARHQHVDAGDTAQRCARRRKALVAEA